MSEVGKKRVAAFVCKCVVAAVLFIIAGFAIGIEVGHRLGYDEGWRDCKFDAKEQLFNIKDDAFWRWNGSRDSVIRKRRSFWLD